MNAARFITQFAVSEGGTFSKKDLIAQINNTSFSPSYIDITLNRMVKSGALTREGWGQYNLSKGKKEFLPYLDALSQRLAAFLKDEMPFAKYCIYEGEWINPFMHHIAGNHLHYLEVQRDSTESAFERLTSNGYTAYLRPNREFMYRYVDIHNESAVIVKPMISESPIIDVNGIPCPAIEKLLVDISKDPDFDYLQGFEYLAVLRNIQRAYTINKPRLLRYASRRSVRTDIAQALQDTSHDID